MGCCGDSCHKTVGLSACEFQRPQVVVHLRAVAMAAFQSAVHWASSAALSGTRACGVSFNLERTDDGQHIGSGVAAHGRPRQVGAATPCLLAAGRECVGGGCRRRGRCGGIGRQRWGKTKARHVPCMPAAGAVGCVPRSRPCSVVLAVLSHARQVPFVVLVVRAQTRRILCAARAQRSIPSVRPQR